MKHSRKSAIGAIFYQPKLFETPRLDYGRERSHLQKLIMGRKHKSTSNYSSSKEQCINIRGFIQIDALMRNSSLNRFLYKNIIDEVLVNSKATQECIANKLLCTFQSRNAKTQYNLSPKQSQLNAISMGSKSSLWMFSTNAISNDS